MRTQVCIAALMMVCCGLPALAVDRVVVPPTDLRIEVAGTKSATALPPPFAAPLDDPPEFEPLDKDEFLGQVEPNLLDRTFSDRVDPFSGTVQINMVDLVLPGNGGLDIVVQRYYSSAVWNRVDSTLLTRHIASADYSDRLGGGGWQFHMGKLMNPSPGLNSFTTLIMPDGATHTLYENSGTLTVGDKITTDGWLYTKSGSIHTVQTTDGRRYIFDDSAPGAQYDYMGLEDGAAIPVVQCTRIEDLNGNAIDIEYSNASPLGYATRLDRISFDDQNDLRDIVFTYLDPTNILDTMQLRENQVPIATWEYYYYFPQPGEDPITIYQPQFPLIEARYIYLLANVAHSLTGDYANERLSNPWTFNYNDGTTPLENGPYVLSEVITPRIGKIAYSYGAETFETGAQACVEAPDFLAVQSRTSAFAVAQDVYEDEAVSTYSYVDGGEEDATTTVVTTDAQSSAVLTEATHVFHGWGSHVSNDTTMWRVGRPKSTTVVVKDDAGDDLETRTTTTVWEQGGSVSSDTRWSSSWVSCGGLRYQSGQTYVKPTSVTRTVERHDSIPDPPPDPLPDPDSYTTVTSSFDNWSNPGLITETSSDGLSRTTNLTYWSDITNNLFAGFVQGRDADPGGVQCIQYDTLGRPTETYTNPATDDVTTCTPIDPISGGRRVSTTYDATGNVATTTEHNTPNHRVTTYSNYKYGLPKDTIITTGTVDDIHYCRDYTPRGMPDWETDGRGCGEAFRVTYSYDYLGRRTESDPPLSDAVTFDYPNQDWGVASVYRDTQRYDYWYNRLGGLTDITNFQTLHQYQLTNDALGRRRQVYLLMNTLAGDTYDYDPLNRLTMVTHPGLPPTQVTFDYAGSRVTVTDENFHATVYDYDAFGSPDDRRLAAVTDAALEVTSYGYEQVFGALASVVAPISQGDRSFAYVSGSSGCNNGFLASETHPESGTTSYEYDCLGLVTERRRPGPETTRWDYDRAGRMTDITYPYSAGTVSMGYDGAGRRTSLSNDWASTAYLYDDAGRLETMTVSIVGGPTGHAFAYTYDTLDRLATLTYPSGRVVTSGWDNRNWLTSLTGEEGSGVEYLSSITYLPTGLPDVITFANGVTTDQGIDVRNRLSSIVTTGPGGSLVNMGLRYDDASNVEFWDDNLSVSKSRQFGYDNLNRLTSAISSGLWGTLSFTYDELGNRASRTLNGSTTTYVYETGTNRLINLTGAEVRAFEYDYVGRMRSEDRSQVPAPPLSRDPDEIFSDGFETGDTRNWGGGSGPNGVFSYTFNAADQLTGVMDGADILGIYTYDGDGLRVAVDDGADVLYYLRGPDGNTLAEYDDMGSLVAEYLYAGGRQIGKVVPDGMGGDDVSFFHADHLGSAMVITDDTGAATWSGENSPFGEPVSSTGTPDRYRFTQHELDTATSLFYAKARYYHPHIGRFLSIDPVGGTLGAPQSWNPYAYVENNPLSNTDPDGRQMVPELPPKPGFPPSLPFPRVKDLLPPMPPMLIAPDEAKRQQEAIEAFESFQAIWEVAQVADPKKPKKEVRRVQADAESAEDAYLRKYPNAQKADDLEDGSTRYTAFDEETQRTVIFRTRQSDSAADATIEEQRRTPSGRTRSREIRIDPPPTDSKEGG
jgi:RHS repeat-associated protein